MDNSEKDIEVENNESENDKKVIVVITCLFILFFVMLFFSLFSGSKKRQEKYESEKIERAVSQHTFYDIGIPQKLPIFKPGEKFRFVITREFEFKGDMREADVSFEIPQDIQGRQKVWDVQVIPKPERIEKRDNGTFATVHYKKPQGNYIVRIEGKAQVRNYNLSVAQKLHKNIDKVLSLDEINKYTKHEAGIDTRSKFVRSFCKKNISTATNDIDTVKNIYDFVFNHMRYDLSKIKDGKKGSIEALASGRGVCEDFVAVFVTLCRIKGIPARAVYGFDLPFQDEIVKNRSGHAWIEVYFDDYGWVTFDPTNNVNDGFRQRIQDLQITPYDALSELIKYRTYLTVNVNDLNVRSKGQGDILAKQVNVTFLKLNQ